ncbi:MAG: hypothetical protein WBA57_00595 [Elainellaceae cyanobacterium]
MADSTLSLNLVEGSVSFSFTREAAEQLQAEMATLLTRLKAVAVHASSSNKSRPAPQPSMEFRHVGDIFLEIFCNPNIWATPFSAKVLITLRDDRIKLTTEAELTRVIEDIHQFLEQTAA